MTQRDEDLLQGLSEAQLDALLAARPHVEDDGFSARVLAELPPPRRSPRRAILGLSALSGVGLALAVPGARALLLAAGHALLQPELTVATVLAFALATSAAIWAAVTA